MPIDNHVHECRCVYNYAERTGFVARLRAHGAVDGVAALARLRQELAPEGILRVAPSRKTIERMSHVGALAGVQRSLQDETLARHELPIHEWKPEWRLCLKSPEFTFVLPALASLLPHACIVLPVRSISRIAGSMHRMGEIVRRFPVYHARWRNETEPPPGIPAPWKGDWISAGDMDRCILYALAYLVALAEGLGDLGHSQILVYDHDAMVRHPPAVLGSISSFLGIEPESLLDEGQALKETGTTDSEIETLASSWTLRLRVGELIDLIQRASRRAG